MAFQAGGAHALDRALEAVAYAYDEMTRVPRTVVWEKPGNVIDRAIRKSSKPFLAIATIEAMSQPGSPGVPEPLRSVVEIVVSLARRTSRPQHEPPRRKRRRR